MPLPELDPDQRQAALAKAAEARRVRADAKQRLKSGRLSLPQFLLAADGSPHLAKMRVSEVLEAMPAYGPIKAERLMGRLDIAPSRRVRGLGARQRAALLATFERDS
ncbi:MAG: integration host factor, actinobacterial type [Nitriliruptoraceae bacterium]